MNRFDIDRVRDRLSGLVSDLCGEDGLLDRLSKLAPDLRGEDGLLGRLAALAPGSRGEEGASEAGDAAEASPAAPAEDDLFARLQGVPGPAKAPDRRMLIVSRARVGDGGEDAFLAARAGNRAGLGVFDGCGGSGGKTYAAFGGHTGAWVAARAAALAARDWFLDPAGDGLTARIDRLLKACKALEPEGQRLLGSLSKEFPTTVAAFFMDVGGSALDVYWCGDSRCYVLDCEGLHQVTRDDASVTDALRNLREDAPMTNVASASQPFALHEARLTLKRPSVVFAATDGCFGYLPSPMAFEGLLLETLKQSGDMADWRRRLDERIGCVSGDDYTLAAWAHGFKSFKAMKRALRGRAAYMERHYPQSEAAENALLRQWEVYRTGYERFPSDGE